MGKGDRLRPVDWEKYGRNYDRIFNCQETDTDTDRSAGNVTPDPDINPAVWEEKDE